ncbi:hypothetical protein AYI68_g5202 [Smittium mucronatum]|uniref:Uncharacterized protein n=1 Tax=Smittium mucronatum TaxID=133383 RepID=A0A1R0GUZ6_9FUNG|nr:hypothetical protein AYI68_g5202 [Smittium mucronatum]
MSDTIITYRRGRVIKYGKANSLRTDPTAPQLKVQTVKRSHSNKNNYYGEKFTHRDIIENCSKEMKSEYMVVIGSCKEFDSELGI